MTRMLAVSSLPLDDVQQFCIVLGILYIVECFWWLRGSSCRLYATPFTEWSEVPGDTPRVDAWRFGLANPLPWNQSFAAETFPFPFDAETLLLPTLDPITCQERYEALPFESIKAITSSERDVFVDMRAVGSFSSTAFAHSTASRLERIRSACVDERHHIAESIIDEIWDCRKAKSHLTAWRKATRCLRDWGGHLTILCLVAGPFTWGCRHWLPQNVPFVLVTMCAVVWFSIAIMGMRIDRRFFPHDSNTGVHLAVAFVSPATAMRLYDTLGRDVMAEYEPLVATLVANDGHGVRATVAAFLRDILFPSGGQTVTASNEASQNTVDTTTGWFRSRMGQHARQAVREWGIDSDALLMQLPVEQGMNTYCPRCTRQFIMTKGECGFCVVPLFAFNATHRLAHTSAEHESS